MFKDNIRKIDIEAIIKFSLIWPIALIIKIKKKDIWLISERPLEAKDNGFWLFKYIMDNEKQPNTYYIINFNSKDYDKIKQYKNVIKYGSIKHYLYYLLADIHISAHIDGGMPNRRVCDFLERKGILKNKKVFLQHGVIKDLLPFTFYEKTRVNLFVCSATKEYEFVKNNFGYPEDSIKLLGLCRFDGLYNLNTKRQILLMPTWRAWLAKDENKNMEKKRSEFIKSEYYKRYNNLINNENLNYYLKENNLNFIFYPHSDMQPYVDLFTSKYDNITIANSQEYDVQQLLKESLLLITDYSSVAFDFAYMQKPIIYYQFDHDLFRKLQHPEGYYVYKEDSFGEIFKEENYLIEKINYYIKNNFKIEKIYENRINSFFDIKDQKNCERTFNQIIKLEK